MEIDLDKIKPVLKRISEYLDKMELNYGEIEVDDIPALIMSFSFDESEEKETKSEKELYQFLVIITTDGEWIAIKSLVGSREEIPKEHLCDIYLDCLKANYALEELTFSADKDGDIFVEADMLADVRFEDFKEEFSSLVLGMQVFIDLMKKYGVSKINTASKKSSKTIKRHTIKDLMYM